MSLHIYLLAAVFITGLCEGTKSESYVAGINEFQECLKTEPLTMNCLDEACVLGECLKLAYDSLYENSSYSLNKNRDLPRVAHCAVDMCVKGVMKTKYNTEGLFSAWTEPVLACLHSVKSCVKDNPRDEL